MASSRSSSFSKWEKASWRIVSYPQVGMSRICNRWSWATFTKGGFLTSFRSFTIFYNWSHSVGMVIFVRVVAFCLFRRMIVIGSQKTFAFIAVWFCHLGPLGRIEMWLGLPFSAARLCTFFKCIVKSHFTLYFSAQSLTLQHHLESSFTHSAPKCTMGKGGGGASFAPRIGMSWTTTTWSMASIRTSWTLGFSLSPLL